ncbi:MAG: hypothetical protein NTV46_05855 [Verrucomicrobia bacterium]|nr:hypothetical protein [Verrucomicrobiota bacterium]
MSDGEPRWTPSEESFPELCIKTRAGPAGGQMGVVDALLATDARQAMGTSQWQESLLCQDWPVTVSARRRLH